MRALWPVDEPAQADYEALREAALAGVALPTPAARRFEREGLVGLIYCPAAKEPVFRALVLGASRPAWTPYADPREEALAQACQLLVEAGALAEEGDRVGGEA